MHSNYCFKQLLIICLIIYNGYLMKFHIITECEIMINNHIAINKSIEFNRMYSYFIITHFKVWRING